MKMLSPVTHSPFLSSQSEFDDDCGESIITDVCDVEDAVDIDHRYCPSGHPTLKVGDKVVVTDVTSPNNFMVCMIVGDI